MKQASLQQVNSLFFQHLRQQAGQRAAAQAATAKGLPPVETHESLPSQPKPDPVTNGGGRDDSAGDTGSPQGSSDDLGNNPGAQSLSGGADHGAGNDTQTSQNQPSEEDQLRAAYQEKFGRPAHPATKLETLREKLAEA